MLVAKEEGRMSGNIAVGGLLALLLISCPLLSWLGEGEAEKLESIRNLSESREILKSSLSNRGISYFEAFASEQQVIVEFEGSKGMTAEQERGELAYVIASTAVAFPYLDEIEAHKLVDGKPKAKARAKTISALRAVGGELAYSEFISSEMNVSALAKGEAILPNLIEAAAQGS